MPKEKTLRDSLTFDEKIQLIIDNMVCRECGGALEIAEIEEMRQVICWSCRKVGIAISPEIYVLAKEYVQLFHWEYYKYTIIEDDEMRERANIGKMCDILRYMRPRLARLDLTQNGGGV